MKVVRRGSGARVGQVWPTPAKPRSTAWRERARVAGDSIGYVAKQWPTSLVVWLLIGIALTLPSAMYVVEKNLARATVGWEGRPGISVYFVPASDVAKASELEARLRQHHAVTDVRLITPDEALHELREQMGLADTGLFDALAMYPLPATIRASTATSTTPATLRRVVEFARTADGVDDVVIEQTWFERLAAMRDVVRQLAVLLAVLFGLGAVLIAAATVRLAVQARIAERDVLALVGADERFIRRPFLYLGVLYGIGGAIAAAMLLSGALVVLETPLVRLSNSYGTTLNLVGFDPMFLSVLLGTGAVLGAIGARLAARARPRVL